MNNYKNYNLYVIANVVSPILLGSFIYLVFRDKRILFFHFAEFIGATSVIDHFRITFLPIRQFVPRWVLYSLPDALWVYSLTSFMLPFWYFERSKIRFFWILIGPIAGVLSEMLQLLKIIPGTFDFVDLVLIIIFSLGSYFSFFILHLNNKAVSNNRVNADC